jgi:hypothetical protein
VAPFSLLGEKMPEMEVKKKIRVTASAKVIRKDGTTEPVVFDETQTSTLEKVVEVPVSLYNKLMGKK